jgi:hypothetical protein
MTAEVKFWLYDPGVLFKNLQIIPSADMTFNEKLNALTRLSIAIGGGLYALGNKAWSTFLVSSVGVIAIIGVMGLGKKKEGFSMNPAYSSTNLEETVIAPSFAEEWRMPPEDYSMIESQPSPGPRPYVTNNDDAYDEDYSLIGEDPIAGTSRYSLLNRPTRTRGSYEDSYPYGQYMTTTNHMPVDEERIRKSKGLSDARSYANGAFLRNRVANQEEMVRIAKKRQQRRFRHTTYDGVSPYSSY